MIQLVRDRTASAVHINFKGAKRKDNNLELLKLKRDGKLDSDVNKVLNSGIWKKAKDQLLIESNQKCAYCETPTSVVSYGDVEHFRPKSIYWWLAYSYENYLPSCTICNQKYKSDNFEIDKIQMKGPLVRASYTDTKLESLSAKMNPDPVNDSEGMPLADLIKGMLDEYPLLIDPYIEDPSEYIAYNPILSTKEVLVVPTHKKYAPVIKACEQYFGINRKELLDLRFQRYLIYMTFKHITQSAALTDEFIVMIDNRIKELSADRSAYAGMIRYFESKPLNDLPWDFNLTIL